jgi:hypothetical protein
VPSLGVLGRLGPPPHQFIWKSATTAWHALCGPLLLQSRLSCSGFRYIDKGPVKLLVRVTLELLGSETQTASRDRR